MNNNMPVDITAGQDNQMENFKFLASLPYDRAMEFDEHGMMHALIASEKGTIRLCMELEPEIFKEALHDAFVNGTHIMEEVVVNEDDMVIPEDPWDLTENILVNTKYLEVAEIPFESAWEEVQGPKDCFATFQTKEGDVRINMGHDTKNFIALLERAFEGERVIPDEPADCRRLRTTGIW